MDTLRRAQLLPKSGVGVVAPWLVIAPPGNAIIRIDLRILNRVRLHGDDEDDEPDDRSDLILVCGDLEIAIYVADGPEAVQRIRAEAAPWTRENGGADKPLPATSVPERASRPASYGRLVIISSTPDARTAADDELAGYVYELTEPVMRIGRTNDNDIIISHGSISRDHAKVIRDPDTGRYSITDLRATNGVHANGERCIGVELKHGDVVDLGQVRTRFVGPGEAVQDSWEAPSSPDRNAFVLVGSDAVLFRGEHIQVGPLKFRVDEVRRYALRGANLPLENGQRLQAATALLVVAAEERDA